MKVLDIGGAIKTYKHATHIIDFIIKPKDCTLEYVQMDVCEGKWPYKDKEFDFVYCSNLLEDVKDPVFVCNEMKRIGKCGKIIVPSLLTECTIGVDTWDENNKYAGFCHHRWLCITNENSIRFIPKWDIVGAYDWTSQIPNEAKFANFYTVLDWKDTFNTYETKEIDWPGYYKFLSTMFKKDPGKLLKDIK